MELPPLDVSARRTPPRFFPQGGKGWITLLDRVLDPSIRYEVFGYVSDSGFFIPGSTGPVNPKAPSVTRGWPSEEFARFLKNPPACAAHTHPFNPQRLFDPPTIADVAIFLEFSLVSKVFRWPRRRKYHFVFTRTGVYTLFVADESRVAPLEGACRNKSLQRCERPMFESIRSGVRGWLREALLGAFRDEGYEDIDVVSPGAGASILRDKARMLRYLEIIRARTGVCIAFEEFVNSVTTKK